MISIGIDYFNRQDFEIDPSRHIAVLGMSGVGKSTLLTNLFVETIRQGWGGCFIDPHGDTADQLMSYIPASRIRDVVWIDPSSKKVPPFNPLYFTDPEELDLAKESLFTVIKSLAGSAWGDESARIIINALDAVCEYYEHPTPVQVARFIADDDFRKRLLDASDDHWLKFFQRQYDEKLRDSEQMSKFSPPLNKLTKLMRSSILPIIGQETSLDFLDIMNSRKIVICRLSKGKLGEEVAQLLGSLIVSMISIAALKREKQKDRPHFMLCVDEIANFIHGGRFGSLLAESRKYGISLVMAFQGLYQLPFAADILSNSPTQIVFNSSGKDAKEIEENWCEHNVNTNTITGLPRYSFHCRTFVKNAPLAQRVLGYPLIEKRGDEVSRTKAIKHSLETYAVNRKKALENIRRFLAG